jgi:cytochrome c1
MPHALESLQGIQDKTEAVKGLENDIDYANGDIATARDKLANGGSQSELKKVIADAETLIHDKQAEINALALEGKYFTLIKEGSMTPQEYDSAMVDLVNFLVYVGEPIQRDRKSLGIYVLIFILFFTFVAYLLKKEYWKDIH